MTKTKLPETLLSADEFAAKHLPGYQGRTVRKWANNGDIPCYRINKKTVLFCPEEVLAVIAKRREHTTAELTKGGAR